jgi:hypothetical protein
MSGTISPYSAILKRKRAGGAADLIDLYQAIRSLPDGEVKRLVALLALWGAESRP